MAKEVTKKDGTKEPFDAEKIKKAIMAAAARIDLPEERKNEVVEQVTASLVQMADAKEEITTVEIREKILSELDALESSISEAWRKHDQEKKGA
jgi:transcriptional regulator NrdR family protein